MDCDDFILNALCKPDRILIDYWYDPYGKSCIAEFLVVGTGVKEFVSVGTSE